MIEKIEKKSGRKIFILYAGDMHVVENGELMQTTVGGCIALVLYDKISTRMGLSHFMLAYAKTDREQERADDNIYGINAVYNLIDTMMKRGSKKTNILASLFGGSNLYQENASGQILTLGRVMLEAEDISIEREDTGGNQSRKIVCDSLDGSVYLRKINREAKHDTGSCS